MSAEGVACTVKGELGILPVKLVCALQWYNTCHLKKRLHTCSLAHPWVEGLGGRGGVAEGITMSS